MKMFIRLSSAFILILTIALPVHGLRAAGGGDSTEPANTAKSSAYNEGRKAVDAKNWDGAISAFKAALGENAGNVDALNYLGFSHRQKGDYDKAFSYYQKALALNRNHRGANEYIGEAYLKTGNVEKAKHHLARLDEICTFGCAEYTMLKRAVEKYQTGQ